MDAEETNVEEIAEEALEAPAVPEVNVELREFEPADANFVFHTWLKSYRRKIHSCPDKLYYPHQQSVIARVCGDSMCLVACDRDNPAFILSYVVGEPSRGRHVDIPMLVHYAFTKLSYRRLGILRALLTQMGWLNRREIHVSHWTRSCRELQEARAFRLINNPYLLMGLPDAS